MRAALKKAVEAIKEAGFSHIKVELEAELGRTGDRGYCDECDGNGNSLCDHCDGEGWVEIATNELGDIEGEDCEECSATGRLTCLYCDGSGYGDENAYNDEGICEEYILDHVSVEARNALTYGSFYEDGSVDSEFTFTLPIENVEYVIEYINAFKSLGEECGGQIDTAGAGMHIAILPTESNGVYPYHYRMPANRIENFKENMTKLLPALFFCASADYRSRSTYFRNPRVSSDNKYSAIYTRENSMFEFRVFETCYDKPETFFDYVKVIANSLAFYANPSLKVKTLGRQFGFPGESETDNLLSRFFSTTERLQILNAQIKYLKPQDKTFKRMRQERGIVTTIKQQRLNEAKRKHILRSEWHKLQEHRKALLNRQLTSDEQQKIDYWMLHYDYSYDRARAAALGVPDNVKMHDFIKSNLGKNTGSLVTV